MYDLIVQYRKDAQPEPSPRWVSLYSFIVHREWWWIFYFISFMFVHGSSHLWFKFRSSWLRRLSPSRCVINNWSVWWFMFSGTLFMWMHVCLDIVFKQMRSVQWSQTHINFPHIFHLQHSKHVLFSLFLHNIIWKHFYYHIFIVFNNA